MSELYIGLMSGTSADGINGVLVDFNITPPHLLATYYQPFPRDIRQAILTLSQSGSDEINRLGKLDVALGRLFAQTACCLKKNVSLIKGIGSHGQTIRHCPHQSFTLQIGDPNIIAAVTGITTVADFRRKDLAHGGQGAPLTPAFHNAVFKKSGVNRVILNIGGIANITILSANNDIVGFDTGPGNTLLDAWTEKHLNQPYDKNGNWAKTGDVDQALLKRLLHDPFFQSPPPKSTGREYFNLSWLNPYLKPTLSPVDIQATLTELTARSILQAIPHSTDEMFICGGGIHNEFLISRLKALGKNIEIYSTKQLGLDPDWIEAIAFAWLAKQTLEKKTGNISAVTGAKKETILGGIYLA